MIMMVVNALESCFSALVLEHFHFYLWDLADALIQSALQKSFEVLMLVHWVRNYEYHQSTTILVKNFFKIKF